MNDIRDALFREIQTKTFRAVLTTERSGVISGVEEAAECAARLGVQWTCSLEEGAALEAGETVAEIAASPKQMALAEERLIGLLAKTSGIATAARCAVETAAGRVKIVSGAWKKMPPQLKMAVRKAVAVGGAQVRISEAPMLYIDKNYIEMFGSVERALTAAAEWRQLKKVVQIKGKLDSIPSETRQALSGGGDVLMIDTGQISDLTACIEELCRLGGRNQVQVAFSGNVRIRDIPVMAVLGVDILGIGKEIIDAQLLDMRLDVVEEIKP